MATLSLTLSLTKDEDECGTYVSGLLAHPALDPEDLLDQLALQAAARVHVNGSRVKVVG